MKVSNRYLVFYVLLALGLALSWNQVGRRAQLIPGAKLHVMSVDGECRPLQAPCAAYAQQFALVLGPDGLAAEGRRLRLLGEQLPADHGLRVQQFDHSVTELDAPRVVPRQPGSWWIEPVLPTGRLRVSLLVGDEQWVAEYPLSEFD